MSDPVWSHWQPVVKSGIQSTSIWCLPWRRCNSHSSMNDTWRDRCLFQRLWMSCHSTTAAASGRWGWDSETDLPAITTFSQFPLTAYSNDLPETVMDHGVQLLLMVRNWGSNSFQELKVSSEKKNGCQKKMSYFKTPEWRGCLIPVQSKWPGQDLRCIFKQNDISLALRHFWSALTELKPRLWTEDLLFPLCGLCCPETILAVEPGITWRKGEQKQA